VNESTHRGPNVGLLLLIPAAAIIAKGAMRHHQAMWAEIDGPEGGAPGMHGHRHPAWRDAGPDGRDGFRLPPRIEWMLETWHKRAHETADAATTTV
jgi:hypothetical protein